MAITRRIVVSLSCQNRLMSGDGQKPVLDARNSRRGLATVALLKINFEAGRDHLAMFEPFAMETVKGLTSDGFSCEELQKGMSSRFQLQLPIETLRTILARMVKSRFVRRDGGRYFFGTKPIPDQRILERAREVEVRQGSLATKLQVRARRDGVVISTEDDALALLFSFLEEYHIDLTLGVVMDGAKADFLDLEQADELQTPQRLVAARFILESLEEQGESARIIQEALEGVVLQNTLLLKDISTAHRKFKNLRCFLDSDLVFGALGYRGAATQLATNELISLLRSTGATVEVFDMTIKEMRGIFAAHEQGFRSFNGRLSMDASEIQRFLAENNFGPADIRQEASLFEQKIRSNGIIISAAPSRQIRFTLDEANLARVLAMQPGEERSPRVMHDVNCIAAILTLRRGREHDSVDDVEAVFVNDRRGQVRRIKTWYEEESMSGVPPAMHYIALSNLAWLKRPAAAGQLKVHELCALCESALRPTRRTWNRLRKELNRLVSSGDLTNEEAIAVVASGLIESLLIDAEVFEDRDADTFTEVIERVRNEQDAKSTAEIRRLQDVTEEQSQSIAAVHDAVKSIGSVTGEVVSWFAVISLMVSFSIGAAASIEAAIQSGLPAMWMVVCGVVPLVLGGLCGLVWGWNLRTWRTGLSAVIGQRVQVIFGKFVHLNK